MKLIERDDLVAIGVHGIAQQNYLLERCILCKNIDKHAGLFQLVNTMNTAHGSTQQNYLLDRCMATCQFYWLKVDTAYHGIAQQNYVLAWEGLTIESHYDYHCGCHQNSSWDLPIWFCNPIVTVYCWIGHPPIHTLQSSSVYSISSKSNWLTQRSGWKFAFLASDKIVTALFFMMPVIIIRQKQ